MGSNHLLVSASLDSALSGHASLGTPGSADCLTSEIYIYRVRHSPSPVTNQDQVPEEQDESGKFCEILFAVAGGSYCPDTLLLIQHPSWSPGPRNYW